MTKNSVNVCQGFWLLGQIDRQETGKPGDTSDLSPVEKAAYQRGFDNKPNTVYLGRSCVTRYRRMGGKQKY